jgi:hypothetical protein
MRNMRRLKRALALTVIAAAFVPATTTFANDTEAQIAIGGLRLIQSANISMDSEDLFVSASQVRVKYHFTNHSKTDVKALIAFPLPDVLGGLAFVEGDSPDLDINALNFRTLVEGKPVTLGVEYVGKVGVRNVTARLKALGWPVNWRGEGDTINRLATLSRPQLEAFVAEKLIISDDNEIYIPNWSIATNITRQQVFPAGKTISVEHSYTPITGGSVAGNLTQSGSYGAQYRKRFCVDTATLNAFNQRQSVRAKTNENSGTSYSEKWISYILKSGANWKGPIKDFRLVVDKGAADSLVSFCMTGVRKISPTQFEVRRTNYEPKQDLDILILD